MARLFPETNALSSRSTPSPVLATMGMTGMPSSSPIPSTSILNLFLARSMKFRPRTTSYPSSRSCSTNIRLCRGTVALARTITLSGLSSVSMSKAMCSSWLTPVREYVPGRS